MPTENSAEPRRRRWFPRTAAVIAIFLCLAGLGVWTYLVTGAAHGRAELAAVLAETDSKAAWRWEQIQEDRQVIPDEENSIRVLRRAADALRGWTEVKLKTGELIDFTEWPGNQKLSEEWLECVRANLKGEEQAVALASSLTEFPRGRAPLKLAPDILSTQLPHIQDGRSTYRLLAFAIERLIQENKAAEAADLIHAWLHVGAVFRDDPFLVAQLVRIAGRGLAVRRTERLLAMSELGDADLTRLLTHFQDERDETPLVVGLRGERAMHQILFENLESGRLALSDFLVMASGAGTGKPDATLRLSISVYKYRLHEDHAALLRFMNQACEVACLPAHEQLSAWEPLEGPFHKALVKGATTKRRILTGLLMPAVGKCFEASVRDQAWLSCIVAGLAAERFRLGNRRWPKTVEELCPTYLEEVPVDAYDGKPLKFSPRSDGLVIYTIGKDGSDDGGEKLTPPTRGSAKSDLGIRLWNPDQRRLKATR